MKIEVFLLCEACVSFYDFGPLAYCLWGSYPFMKVIPPVFCIPPFLKDMLSLHSSQEKNDMEDLWNYCSVINTYYKRTVNLAYIFHIDSSPVNEYFACGQ